MKRKELIKFLERHGCALLKEGAKHSRYINLADLLSIKICRQLGVPDPR